ncbi:MAG: glutamine synthetase type, partial [Solirubrobacterales bacterium]|nr:glutamine synthetase type [Solirubrobacterales bacterium]
KPPKGHELDEHYFGSIPERVLAYMMDAEEELSKLGVPIKTRHNEVAPAQYELAPIFENSNISSDHQQLTMQVLQSVARKYGLVCLLHEKPFQALNGSGKHNNWSMGTDTGSNLLKPGDTPETNAQFLFFCAAVIKAVNKHQALLRASVANAGQDHRLGANEAPPAIISIFLGKELENAFEMVATGKGTALKKGVLSLGTEVLPVLPKDGGDRNRTSPFAFTGNRFEFRAVGSSMSLGFVNTVLNTIAAEALDELSAELATELKTAKGDVFKAVSAIVKKVWTEDRAIVFDGDGYSEAWHKEAEKRGLLNLPTTPDALPYIVSKPTVDAFKKYKVLSKRELESRYEVFVEQYSTKLNIEAETTATIARTMILPAAMMHAELIGDAGESAGLAKLKQEITTHIDDLIDAIFALEAANDHDGPEGGVQHAIYMRDTVIPAMTAVRTAADKLEKIVTDDFWPMPKYSEMLFIK